MRLCTNLEIKLLRAKIWALKAYYSYRITLLAMPTLDAYPEVAAAVDALKLRHDMFEKVLSMNRIWN